LVSNRRAAGHPVTEIGGEIVSIAGIVGIALIVFGAVVLVVLPKRPGAKIGWHGAEISSAGAGLPLIFLGLVAVLANSASGAVPVQLPGVLAGVGSPLQTGQTGGLAVEGRARTLSACFGEVLAAIPADRVWQLEAGVEGVELVGPHQSKQDSFAVQLTDGGRPVGLVVLRLFLAGEVFRVEHAMEHECRPASHQNVSRGGDPDTMQNWDSLRLELSERFYELRPGLGDGRIYASFTRVVL
jgi:hypothetical protein